MAQDISDNKYKKLASKPKGTRSSDAITGLNAQDQQGKDQAAMKYNYLTAIGALGTSDQDNAKGKGKDAIAGDYGGNTDNWGWAQKGSNTFLNFNPAEAQAKVQTAFPPIEPYSLSEFEEPIMAERSVMGKRDVFEDKPLLGIANQFNFDLGDARQGASYEELMQSMTPEKKAEFEAYMKQIQDPEALAQVGKFDFKTGTDATPMSAESQAKWQDRFQNDMDLRAWAYNNDIDLENIKDREMQYGLGYDREKTNRTVVEGTLKASGSNLKYEDIFDEYTPSDHELGRKKYNEKERYSKVVGKNKVDKIKKRVGEEEYETGKEKYRKSTRKGYKDRKGNIVKEWEEPYNG